MAQTSIEINGKLHLFQIWDDPASYNFTHCFKCKMNKLLKRLFENIHLLIIIDSFIKFKVLFSIVIQYLTIRMHYNQNNEDAIDRSSIFYEKLPQ